MVDYHRRSLGDNGLWDLPTFPAGLLRCKYRANGIGRCVFCFFFTLSLTGGVREPAAELNACARCWGVHKTISRLKCDCFNTLIHLSLAFRMLQKLPNYSCALYPAWLKLDRGISLRLSEILEDLNLWTVCCVKIKTQKQLKHKIDRIHLKNV